MSEQIPAGWYPDPKETGDPRPQRWWDGKGWTASTRPAPSDAPAPPPEPPAPTTTPAPGAPAHPEPSAAEAPGAAGDGTAEQPRVLEGEVLSSGPSVRYPEPPPVGALWGAPAEAPRKARRKPSKLVTATALAAVLGLGVGSGITYLAMDGRGHDRQARATWQPVPNGGKGQPGFGDGSESPGGGPGGGPNGGGNGSGGNGGGGTGKAKPGAAIDIVNRLSIPVPAGWKGSHTSEGFAAAYVGSYSCADDPAKECTLGGLTTGRIDGGGSDAQAAAKADIEKAAKESYGDLTGHQELKNEAVTVNGQDGWLVRWKADPTKGNSGYVETVVFPSSDGKALISVHFGFDIADKAPDVSVMDTIVKGITDFKGKLPQLPGGGAKPGQNGGQDGGPNGTAGTTT